MSLKNQEDCSCATVFVQAKTHLQQIREQEASLKESFYSAACWGLQKEDSQSSPAPASNGELQKRIQQSLALLEEAASENHTAARVQLLLIHFYFALECDKRSKQREALTSFNSFADHFCKLLDQTCEVHTTVSRASESDTKRGQKEREQNTKKVTTSVLASFALLQSLIRSFSLPPSHFLFP